MPWRVSDPGGKPGRIDMGGNQLAEPVVAVVPLARLGGGGGVASPQYLQCVLRTPCAGFNDHIKVNRDEFALPAGAFINEYLVQLVIRQRRDLLDGGQAKASQRLVRSGNRAVRAPELVFNLAVRTLPNQQRHHRTVIRHQRTPSSTRRTQVVRLPEVSSRAR